VQRLTAAVCPRHVQDVRKRAGRFPETSRITAGFAAGPLAARAAAPGWRRPYPCLLDWAHNVPARRGPASGMVFSGPRSGAFPIPGCGWVGILSNKQAPELLGALLALGEAGLAGAGARPSSWNRDSSAPACPSWRSAHAAADLPESLAGRCHSLRKYHASRQASAPAAGPASCGRGGGGGWVAVSAGQPARWRANSQHGEAGRVRNGDPFRVEEVSGGLVCEMKRLARIGPRQRLELAAPPRGVRWSAWRCYFQHRCGGSRAGPVPGTGDYTLTDQNQHWIISGPGPGFQFLCGATAAMPKLSPAPTLAVRSSPQASFSRADFRGADLSDGPDGPGRTFSGGDFQRLPCCAA